MFRGHGTLTSTLGGWVITIRIATEQRKLAIELALHNPSSSRSILESFKSLACCIIIMSMPTTSARIFLVRHGETDWITGGKFASRTDVPLSTMGERDVELIRERLVAENEMIDPTGVAKMSVQSLQGDSLLFQARSHNP